MRGNPDNLANQLIQKIKDWLEDEVEAYEEYEDEIGDVDSFDDGILEGRKECAECLLEQIKKWEKDNG